MQELEAVRQLQEHQAFFENKMLEQHFSFAQTELQHKQQSLLQQSEQQLAAAQERLQAERRRHATEVERMQRHHQLQAAAARQEYDEKLAKMQKTMAELNNLEKHLHNWRIAMQQQQAKEEKQKEQDAKAKKEGKKPQPKQKSDKKSSPPDEEAEMMAVLFTREPGNWEPLVDESFRFRTLASEDREAMYSAFKYATNSNDPQTAMLEQGSIPPGLSVSPRSDGHQQRAPSCQENVSAQFWKGS